MKIEILKNKILILKLDLNEFYIISPYQNMTRWKKEDFMKFNKLKKLKFCKKDFSYTSNNNKSFLSINNLKKILLNL